jgi:beta-lactam-binding protein with PASTA domain
MRCHARPALLLLALALLLAPTAALAAPDLVTVPDVSGQPRADAKATLQAQGFLVAVFEVAGTPPDTVAAQSPAAGTTVPRGTTAILDVRRSESDTAPAPNGVGLTPAAAISALSALYVLKFEPVDGAEGDRGKVVSQSPAMGSPLEIRGLLTLRFVPDPTLPAKLPVPDVLGLPAADAIQALGSAGLVARVARAEVAGTPADAVVGQWPLAGTEADRYAVVDVIAATSEAAAAPTTPPPPVTVPNCVGMSESSARAALDEAHLGATVEWVEGDPASAFLVVSQQPEAGAEIPADTDVVLRIVKYLPPAGPAPASQVALPNLVGMSQWQAEDLLLSLGLFASPVLVVTDAVPALRVFAQQMAPGTWVPVGSAVVFRVAKPLPPPAPVPVPDFYGKTKATAWALAALAGLVLDPHDVVNPAKPPHRVYSQSVPAWSVVPIGTTITVLVAKPPPGPPMTNVPNLIGKTQAQANAALAAALLAGNVTFVWAPTKPLLLVYQQTPAPGTSLPVGSVVQYKISKLPVGFGAVPDLAGKTKLQAAAAVSAAGFTPMPQEVFAPPNPVGKVFWQNPAAGTLKALGTGVAYKIAVGLTVAVPDVVGKTKAQAEAALTAAGFGHATLLVFMFGKPAGRVWDQTPNGGALAMPGTVVQLKVQPGAVMTPIPNVVGKAKAQADAILAAAGFTPNGSFVVNPLKPLNLVYDQAPNAGVLAAAGSPVAFQVAVLLPPAMVAVPNLFGKTKVQAVAALTAVGLAADPDEVVNPLKPLGKVYSQSPLAGTGVASGTVVHFKVAVLLGPPPALVAVPNVIGLTGPQAKAAIEALGLVSQGSIVINPFKPANKVYSQTPAAGTMVAAGHVVKWKRNP